VPINQDLGSLCLKIGLSKKKIEPYYVKKSLDKLSNSHVKISTNPMRYWKIPHDSSQDRCLGGIVDDKNGGKNFMRLSLEVS
jgi:hypothetical protein